MERKTIIWIIIVTLLIFIMINKISSVQEFKEKIPMMRCQDYEYFIEFEGPLPVEIEFYTIENGKEEFFKKNIANEPSISTLLHCGHDYKAIYSFGGYEDFIDYFSIPEYNPLIVKTTKISIPEYNPLIVKTTKINVI